MKKILAVLVFGIVIFPAVLGASLSRPVVTYDIKARLLPESKTVEGRELLTWLNDSAVPVSELRFHLYLNAFKNSQTTFITEGGAMHRGFALDRENWGFITVREIGVTEGVDLKPTMRFVQPDDGNANDETVMAVELPGPVKPGERVSLSIGFLAKLPRVFARSGFSGDFFMVGQWFPKIGVFQNGAWNCHQYHASSEFFADFGTFRVEMTVPEKYVVGATGKRVSETANGDGTKTYVHVQEDVHDFAWAACPDFVEFRERFEQSEPRVSTEMIFLVHRAHLRQKDRLVAALRNALEFYSTSYGPYPYDTITLVDPAPGALAAGGMEYPTLFTTMTMSWMPRGVRMPEMVTIHEFGHGYWYGMVASNEFEEAWLDEGINTYSEIKAMSRYYGDDRSMIDLAGIRIGELPYQRLSVIGSGRFDPIVKTAWDFIGDSSYSLNVYNKAGLMMLTLERLLGDEVMSRVMKTYFERWKFRHPTTKDFIAVAEEVSGQDLAWFFNQVLYSPDKLDYAISDLKAEEIPQPEGIFGEPGTAGPGRPSSGANPPLRPKSYRNVVTAARVGEWIFPVDLLVKFANGETVRETWDGRDRWTRFVYFKNVKVVSAEVDPDHKLVLDVNYANNSRLLDLKRPAVVRAALGVMAWFQGVLSLISF